MSRADWLHGLLSSHGHLQISTVQRDTDGDGLTDDCDSCPDTQIGASIDRDGCSLQQLGDADQSGVADALDECLGTPPRTLVGLRGCRNTRLPVHTQHNMVLQRNVLYTGVARGKQLVVLVGMPKAVAIAVRRVDAVKRYSAFRSRLQNDRSGVET